MENNFINYSAYYESPKECGGNEALSEAEDFLAHFIYWARLRRKGLKTAIEEKFFPAPKGKLYRNPGGQRGSVWVPHPNEGCDFCFSLAIEEKEKFFNPWFFYKHCCSLQHTKYLVKHRFNYIKQTIPNQIYYYLHGSKNVNLKKNLPLLVNIKDPLTKEFIDDFFCGKIFDTTEN